MRSIHERRYRPAIEEAAIHKETFQINGQEFTCHEAYYEGELLNGVDLKIKEMRGLDADPELIDFLRESQELVFWVSSSIVLYNTHKKTYQHLLNVEGEVTILKTRLDKTNNREYIMWVERQSKEKEQEQFILKKYGKAVNNAFKESRLKKRVGVGAEKQRSSLSQEDSLLKTLFSGFGQDGKASRKDLSHQKKRKVTFTSNQDYFLKVYDYTKREYVFSSEIKIQRETVTNLLLFCNEIKAIGYVTEDPEINSHYINYAHLNKIDSRNMENSTDTDFSYLELKHKIEHLEFNPEESCYVFTHSKTFYRLGVHEHATEETTLIAKYLEFSSKGQQPTAKPIKITIKQQSEFETPILDIALNDQYLAVLTADRIYFHSAFDSQALIFVHQLQEPSGLPPLGIQFNKSSLMLTHKSSSLISSYQIRSKNLRLLNETTLELSHCKQILKLYCNSITSQIFCIVNFYELGSRTTSKSLKRAQETKMDYIVKPAFIDVSISYLSPASRTEAKILKIGKQKFKQLHSCPWMSQYLIETEDSVYIGTWKETFEGKRCIGLHPTGIFLVACLKDTFKIYMITFEGITNTYRGDTINDIQNCAFSNQGNHLTISNSSVIFIYDFYSCTRLRTFNLPLGVAIESMVYRGDFLCCCLKNKKLYIYNSIQNYKEVLAFNPKAYISQVSKEETVSSMAVNLTYQLFNYISIHAIFYDPVYQVIIFSAKGAIYFYNCLTSQIIITVDADPITCFHYCQNLKVLFMGTENGEVFCFPWPNKPSNLMDNYPKFKLHKGSIVSMVVSSDLKELVTLGEDNSLSICYLTLVKNLKRLEGLQLIEFMGPNIQVNFDPLQRRGFHQYTHTEFNSKVELLKDYEEETMNLTFMMPEERMKQKEQMLSSVTDQTFKLTQVNNKEYEVFGKITSAAKEEVNELREQLDQFWVASRKEKKEIKEIQYEDYLQKYNASEKSKKHLNELRATLALEIKRQREEKETVLRNFRDKCEADLVRLQEEYQTQKSTWCTERPEELEAIDQEKQEFIEQNVEVLEDVINGYNMSNGSLTCKNNNLEKDIMQLKKKIEEHCFLLYRLKVNTAAMGEEQRHYEEMKGEKEKLLEREDKVNLVQIQKRYIKQTKILIERDKEINVKITMHDKEQSILIYLERCLESIEQNIENVVENLLEEKKQFREQGRKETIFRNNWETITLLKAQKKKVAASLANAVNNYLYSLSTTADHLIADRKTDPRALLTNQELIPSLNCPPKKDQQPTSTLEDPSEELLENNYLKMDPGNCSGWNKEYRKLKTEGDQSRKTEGGEQPRTGKGQAKDNPLTYRLRSSPRKGALEGNGRGLVEGTGRKLVDRNSRKVMFRQREEQKQYQRVQTEQLVYENSFRKINKENQDLIESYNTLAMESKRISDSLKRQKMMNAFSLRKDQGRKRELNPTPFQKYLKNLSKKEKPSKVEVPGAIYQF